MTRTARRTRGLPPPTVTAPDGPTAPSGPNKVELDQPAPNSTPFTSTARRLQAICNPLRRSSGSSISSIQKRLSGVANPRRFRVGGPTKGGFYAYQSRNAGATGNESADARPGRQAAEDRAHGTGLGRRAMSRRIFAAVPSVAFVTTVLVAGTTAGPAAAGAVPGTSPSGSISSTGRVSYQYTLVDLGRSAARTASRTLRAVR